MGKKKGKPKKPVHRARDANPAYKVVDEKKVYEFKENEKLFQGKVSAGVEKSKAVEKAERVFEKAHAKASKARVKAKDTKVKGGANRTLRAGKFEARQKVIKDSDGNSAVEASVAAERTADNTYHFVEGMRRHQQAAEAQKLAKFESGEFHAGAKLEYRKYLQEHPELDHKPVQKQLQKTRIKREYAKELKSGAEKEAVAETASKGKQMMDAASSKVQEFVSKHKKIFVGIAASGLLLMTVSSTFSACGAVFSDGSGTVLAGSYLSEPRDIDAAALAFTDMEASLVQQIANIETDYPDYDEYDYDLADIGHNPAILIGYLSAKFTEFTLAEVESELQALFDGMYTLELTPETVTRYRDKTDEDGNVIYDEETGEPEQEAYTVKILHVKLTKTPLESVVAPRMDADQQELYEGLGETKGLLQVYGSPVDMDWYNLVSSYYGYRSDPFTDAKKLHRGVDIAIPTGTSIYSGQDGTVTYVGYDADGYGNYIVIENAEGYMSKYAHLSQPLVSQGQAVSRGDLIARSGNTGGSTGPHLHFECLYQGEYYNPLFYFESGGISP